MGILVLLISSILTYLLTSIIYQRLVVNYPEYAFDKSHIMKLGSFILNLFLQFKFLNTIALLNIPRHSILNTILVIICFFSIAFISSCISIICFIDILIYEIPNELSLLIGLFMVPVSLVLYSGSSILTGIIIFSLYLGIALLTDNFGMGDVKLSLALGIGIKFNLLLKFVFLSFLLAFIFSIIKILKNKSNIKKEIPFAPFIALSFILLF